MWIKHLHGIMSTQFMHLLSSIHQQIITLSLLENSRVKKKLPYELSFFLWITVFTMHHRISIELDSSKWNGTTLSFSLCECNAFVEPPISSKSSIKLCRSIEKSVCLLFLQRTSFVSIQKPKPNETTKQKTNSFHYSIHIDSSVCMAW